MNTNIKVVIGANAGDEGKGLVTDYFAEMARLRHENCIVVLSNGGSQRGHTVSLGLGDYHRHVFRHFGSGLFAGADTYIPEYYIVNPMNFMKEYNELGIFAKPVYINKNCLLTTPFDMIANQIIEDARGDQRHGSCGVGIWETILRNGITVGEMYDNLPKAEEYLKYVRDDYFKSRLLDKGIRLTPQWEKIVYSQELIDHYLRDLCSMYAKSFFATNEILNTYDNVIFENGQGLLLDQNIVGYGKNTTPSNTGLQNPAKIIKDTFLDCNVEVCYVSRTYMTRHGAGRFDTEWEASKISDKIKTDLTNLTHPYQGALRYGFLEWNDLEHRVLEDFEKWGEKDWKLSFVFTHMNEFDKLPFEKIKKDYFLYISDGKTRNSIRSI